MPQLSRLCTISGDEKKLRILDSVPVQIAPALGGVTLFDFSQSNNGILVVTAGTAYNITPNVSFTANVVAWGAGGSPAAAGGGGFSTGTIQFQAGVSYNVAAGSAGASSSGGGGSGIEFLANANPILIAGGGGGGASGGAGGGVFAANGTGLGATSYGAASPGTYRTGGPGTGSSFGMGFGGTGTGAGGGGMYGGALNATSGGGGAGWISPSIDPTGNTITGSGASAANPSHPLRGNFGDAANNGLIVITILNT